MAELETQLAYFKHDAALVESRSIGPGTRIGAFAHVLPGARIGAGCSICDHTFVADGVCIGDRVTIQSGAQLSDGVTLEDDVFIGPNVTFTSEGFPGTRSNLDPGERTIIASGASIGANASVLTGVTVGEKAVIGAGSVISQHVPPLAVVAGNPARIVGYVGAESISPGSVSHVPAEPGVFATKVAGVTIHRLPFFQDLRGMLSFGEMGDHVPFQVKRYFLTFGVSSQKIRGEHAHRELHQFFVCVHGRCHVVADDGRNRQEFVLDTPTLGVHLPPMVWGIEYKHTKDAVLLVLASEKYDPADYIRDYAEFLKLTQTNR